MTLHHAEIAARRARILRELHDARLSLPQTALVERLGLTRKEVVYAVRTLARDGLVTKEPHPDYRDRVIVRMVRCSPEHRLHIVPHKGCILR